MDIKKLTRKNIQELVPYQSARSIGGDGDIWLNANELYDFSYFNLNNIRLNRYPEFQPKNLLKAYSRYSKVNSEQILITRGSDEAIELLIKTFCEFNKDKIIFCPPTYDMYEVSSKIIGIESIAIPLSNVFQLDINAISNHINNVKLIYICNPNNPTGNLINSKDIVYILKLVLGKALVIIDEAYIEFCSMYSMTALINEFPNLVILRTLSKAFALAGLRCGFLLSNVNIIKVISKVINPYPISLPVVDIAIQSLNKKNINLMKRRVLHINLNRVWFINKLKSIKCVNKVFDSVANYVLVNFVNSKEVFEKLHQNKIVVRNQSQKINLKNCIRISIGSRFECAQVIKIIKK